jgi:dipeptidyl aminopeptidase/acylaminoacyl peptidase
MLPRLSAFIFAALPVINAAFADASMQSERMETVDIELEDITLVGRYYQAQGTERGPAVIMLHGWNWPDNDPSAGLVSAVPEFQRAGYSVLIPSMRGWRPTGGVDDCAGKQVADVLQAIEWIGRQPRVDADQIFLVGFSQGGQVALLAATHNPPVRAVAAFAPVVDPGSWGSETNINGIRDYVMEECGGPAGWRSRNVMSRADKIQQPLLLVHGDLDRRVPTQQSIGLYRKLVELDRHVQLRLIAGAEHDQDAVLRPRIAIDFFRKIIGDDHAQSSASTLLPMP